ncbi:MAG: hypothetical protein ACSLE0_20870 [Chitinophagaceae bacterium]
MKNFSFTALFLIILTLVGTSCYSSRKNGCPGNPQGSYRFKG